MLTNDTNEINIIKKKSPKKLVLNFTKEVNKTITFSFLNVLICTNYKDYNFITSTYKKTPPITTPVPSTLKVNVPSNVKSNYN